MRGKLLIQAEEHGSCLCGSSAEIIGGLPRPSTGIAENVRDAVSEVQIKKYQPDRQDILWNTEWGILQNDLEESEAVSQGLVLYRGRWITKDEKKTLTSELWSYKVVKVVGTLMFVTGWLALAGLLVAFVRIAVGGGAAAVQALTAGISSLPFAVFFIVCGRALKRFKRWAWVLTVLGLALFTLMFCIGGVFVFAESFQRSNGPESLVTVIFSAVLMGILGLLHGTALYFVVNRTGRRIFRPPLQEEDSVDQEPIRSFSPSGTEPSSKPPKTVVSNQQLPAKPPRSKGSSTKRLSAKEVLVDINSGLDDVALMQKYGLSAKQMAYLYDKLAAKGLLKQ